jgi:isochorismate synthase
VILDGRRRRALARRLHDRMNDGVRAARARGRPVLASLTIVVPAAFDPRAVAAAALHRGDRAFLWSRRTPLSIELSAMGAAVSVRVRVGRLHVADGEGRDIPVGPAPRSRFDAAETARAWTLEGALKDARAARREPRFVGGFSFGPVGCAAFPAALLWIPRLQIVRDAQGARATFSCLAWSDDDPAAMTDVLLADLDAAGEPPAADDARVSDPLRLRVDPEPIAWLERAERARRLIGAGSFEKVVLVRRCRVDGSHAFDPLALHARLASRFPSCFAFLLGERGDAFVGATPELLVRRKGLVVRSGSLAGSIGRGRTATEDRRLARDLVESKKEQAEHEIVVRAIREALAPRCRALDVPVSPRLVRLSNIQHLHTPVTGTLRAPEPLLSLVGALHPTPAVGGYPRGPALRALRGIESFDRGWYAGPVGWIDAAGDGEFAVAIRSARIRGAGAELYAGAGIVQDSDPRIELGEIETKLGALLDALGSPGGVG